MLRKLLKYEFQATGRLVWIAYAAMVFFTLLSHFTIGYIETPQESVAMAVVAGLSLFAWVMCLVICIVITEVLVVYRFYKNFLTDEGYLMFTLPTGVHRLILSKLIAGLCWLLLAIILAVAGTVFVLSGMDVGAEFGDVMSNFRMYITINGEEFAVVLAVLEVILLLLASIATSLLQFYGAMALGHSFNSHRGLISVGCYFGISLVIQIIAGVGSALLAHVEAFNRLLTANLQLTLGLNLLWQIVIGVALYLLTAWNLKKRLNLA